MGGVEGVVLGFGERVVTGLYVGGGHLLARSFTLLSAVGH